MSVDSLLHAASPLAGSLTPVHAADHAHGWWRSAVIYQVYPRSFRDLNGDGIGDLAGITAELPQLAELDVDAVWLSPFYRSPQRDAGYDVSDYCDVDPLFGKLGDFDGMIAEANRLGLRVIVDLVPNHCSDQHAISRLPSPQAPAAPNGTCSSSAKAPAPRARSRPTTGSHTSAVQPGPASPNRTASRASGTCTCSIPRSRTSTGTTRPSMTSLSASCASGLTAGVSGFRVDVAHALVKAPGLPAWGGRADGSSSDGFPGHEAPMFGQPALHEIYRGLAPDS